MPRWGGKASLGTLFSSLGQNLVALSIVLPSIPEFSNRSLPTTSQFLIHSQLRKVLFTNLTWVIKFGNWKKTVTSDLGWWKIRWKSKKMLVATSRRLTTCTEKMVLVSWLGRCFGNSKDCLFMVLGFSIGSCTCRWWSEPVHKLCPKLNPKSRSILRGNWDWPV